MKFPENYEEDTRFESECMTFDEMTKNMPLRLFFDDRFTNVILDAEKEFERHLPEKGDSWKDCNIEQLVNPLWKVFEKWLDCHIRANRTQEYQELLDLINMCLMLAERLRGDRDEMC